MDTVLQPGLFEEMDVIPKPVRRTTAINNRRYLGNKYKLLPFIKAIVHEHCADVRVVADVFAGTGAVASAFTDKVLITNDLMYSNYICHVAWFSPQPYSVEKIRHYIDFYNTATVDDDNYMSEHFSDTFFSRNVCRRIGFVREDIQVQYDRGLINERERALLITSLLYALDKIANTCGHYDAYRQGIEPPDTLELLEPEPARDLNKGNRNYNADANELVRTITADLVYIDPPYNSRQYCDAYHLPENVAMWDKPEVHGVARKMDRQHLKSDYCTLKAAQAFEDLIANISAKYILISYNNMAEKGNGRSNAKLSDEDIMRALAKKGSVQVFAMAHRAFSTGKATYTDNEERLFLCTCTNAEALVASPLNYTGGKFKLLPQLLPCFPKNVHTFIDLFCGGANVGLNISCNQLILNDCNPQLLEILRIFSTLEKETVFAKIDMLIDRYDLSRCDEHGYDYYGCDSSEGLGSYNRDGFLQLRTDYNRGKYAGNDKSLALYVLIVFAFNNQIRFNQQGEYNLPVGKRDFNQRMRDKLSLFVDRLKHQKPRMTCADFRQFYLAILPQDSFVYADPPYLITCASYNEQGKWDETDERDLLAFLDGLHERGVRFALSNVLRNKERTNSILASWIECNAHRYRVINLKHSYANSNYQTKNREAVTEEILVVNYPSEKNDNA